MNPMDAEPVIISDTREQTPLKFTHLRTERAALQTGDYSVRGLEEVFSVERKSLPDLVGSLTRERMRFMREMHRLRGYQFARLLVIGSEMELMQMVNMGRANLNQLEHSLLAISVRYGVPAVRVDTPERAGVIVETWAWAVWRDALAKVGKKVGFPEWTAGVLTKERHAESVTNVTDFWDKCPRKNGTNVPENEGQQSDRNKEV